MPSSERERKTLKISIGDYIGSTMHFDTVEHGAYLLLLMAYWARGGPLPYDDERLRTICRVSRYKWRKIRGKVLAQFWIQGDVIRHCRLDTELAAQRGSKHGR
ncbi:MAG: DUF1376 domain-containing protein [Alphaproteobacteria bacterium]